jgi:hypothetical protein
MRVSVVSAASTGQGRTCSVHLKALLMVPGATPEQAQADDAIAHDHNRREHRIACEPRFLGRRCNHHRDNECDFDHGDGDR